MLYRLDSPAVRSMYDSAAETGHRRGPGSVWHGGLNNRTFDSTTLVLHWLELIGEKSNESKLPSLGIVTISYNQARFLTEAIDSVRLRDPDRLRYVIVDPGSTDGSREIIRCRHDRFSAIILEPDSGPADGLNKGFATM